MAGISGIVSEAYPSASTRKTNWLTKIGSQYKNPNFNMFWEDPIIYVSPTVSIRKYDDRPTYLKLLQSDGSVAASNVTETWDVEYENGEQITDGYYSINVRLKSEVKQSESTNNAWYPTAIAGMQYANMHTGNCLPIYYCSSLSMNPSTGAFKANKYQFNDGNYAVKSNTDGLKIQVVSSLPASQAANTLYIVIS